MNIFRLLTAVCAGLAFIGFAAEAQSISVGVYGGVNVSTAETTGGGTNSEHYGPIAGAAFEVGLMQTLAFRAEAQYVQRGGTLQLTTSSSSTPITTQYTLDYLEIPINVRLNLNQGSPTFYAYGGTTLGTLLAATADRDGQTNQDVKNSFETMTISLDIGGGVDLALSEAVHLRGDLRYNYALTDEARQQQEFFAVDSWKSRAVKGVVGLYFQL